MSLFQPTLSNVEPVLVSVTLVAFLCVFSNLFLPFWHQDQNYTGIWGAGGWWIIGLHEHVSRPLCHFIFAPPKDCGTGTNSELALTGDSPESLQDLFPERWQLRAHLCKWSCLALPLLTLRFTCHFLTQPLRIMRSVSISLQSAVISPRWDGNVRGWQTQKHHFLLSGLDCTLQLN